MIILIMKKGRLMTRQIVKASREYEPVSDRDGLDNFFYLDQRPRPSTSADTLFWSRQYRMAQITY